MTQTLEQFFVKLDDATSEAAAAAIFRELQLFGVEMSAQIKRNLAAGVGPKSRTGRLSRAVTSQARAEPEGASVSIGVFGGVPYARWMEYGSAAHPIYPRRSAYLRFEGASGEIVFARKVNHPGTPAYYFVRTPIMAARGALATSLKLAITKVLP
jgi:hypothetical protein